MKDIRPQLIADVTLYPTDRGGRRSPTAADWFGCPCVLPGDGRQMWDCRLLLAGRPMVPGETRRIGMVFLSGELAANKFRAAGKFFLWDGRIIGEATTVAEGLQ